MQLKQRTAIEFRWKRSLADPEVTAVIYALHYGYRKRDSLLQALPQFHVNRLENAVARLISHGLVELYLDEIHLMDEVIKLDQLTQSSPLVISQSIPFPQPNLGHQDLVTLLEGLGFHNHLAGANALKAHHQIVEEVGHVC